MMFFASKTPQIWKFFFIATSVQDLKLVVAVKYGYAFRAETKVMVNFGVFGLLRLWNEENINNLILQ